MQILKKEILEFSEKETDALAMMAKICEGIMREATDPNLIKLAEQLDTYICELWSWEEN